MLFSLSMINVIVIPCSVQSSEALPRITIHHSVRGESQVKSATVKLILSLGKRCAVRQDLSLVFGRFGQISATGVYDVKSASYADSL
jgi:hypothetical protein